MLRLGQQERCVTDPISVPSSSGKLPFYYSRVDTVSVLSLSRSAASNLEVSVAIQRTSQHKPSLSFSLSPPVAILVHYFNH